jgi:hypothetical protein
LDNAIPTSLFVALSSIAFVGLVADDPMVKIKLKIFHSKIINNYDKLNAKVSNYRDIPEGSKVTEQQVLPA